MMMNLQSHIDQIKRKKKLFYQSKSRPNKNQRKIMTRLKLLSIKNKNLKQFNKPLQVKCNKRMFCNHKVRNSNINSV